MIWLHLIVPIGPDQGLYMKIEGTSGLEINVKKTKTKQNCTLSFGQQRLPKKVAITLKITVRQYGKEPYIYTFTNKLKFDN